MIAAVATAFDRDAFEQAVARGSDLLKQGKLDDAQKAFAAALLLDDQNAKVLALLGLTYFRGGKLHQARPIYEDLVERLPTDASHRLNLGLVYLKLGDAEKAINSLEASRALDPSQGRAVSYLGLAYARAGRYAEAYRAFLLAGQKRPRERDRDQPDERRARADPLAARAQRHRRAEARSRRHPPRIRRSPMSCTSRDASAAEPPRSSPRLRTPRASRRAAASPTRVQFVLPTAAPVAAMDGAERDLEGRRGRLAGGRGRRRHGAARRRRQHAADPALAARDRRARPSRRRRRGLRGHRDRRARRAGHRRDDDAPRGRARHRRRSRVRAGDAALARPSDRGEVRPRRRAAPHRSPAPAT